MLGSLIEAVCPHAKVPPRQLRRTVGRVVALTLMPGQAHKLPHAVALLAQLPDVPGWVVADRSNSSHAFREPAREACGPAQVERSAGGHPDWIYIHRNQVERIHPASSAWHV